MKLEILRDEFSICKVESIQQVNLEQEYLFIGKTDKEVSVVCKSEEVPNSPRCIEGGWRIFRIIGQLDFSLIGILSRITTELAKNEIGVFVVSTYDTDYVLVKDDKLGLAIQKLEAIGYEINS